MEAAPGAWNGWRKNAGGCCCRRPRGWLLAMACFGGVSCRCTHPTQSPLRAAGCSRSLALTEIAAGRPPCGCPQSASLRAAFTSPCAAALPAAALNCKPCPRAMPASSGLITLKLHSMPQHANLPCAALPWPGLTAVQYAISMMNQLWSNITRENATVDNTLVPWADMMYEQVCCACCA